MRLIGKELNSLLHSNGIHFIHQIHFTGTNDARFSISHLLKFLRKDMTGVEVVHEKYTLTIGIW